MELHHHHGDFECKDDSSSGLQGSTIDVVEDSWDHKVLEEHLTAIVNEEEWPHKPEPPSGPGV